MHYVGKGVQTQITPMLMEAYYHSFVVFEIQLVLHTISDLKDDVKMFVLANQGGHYQFSVSNAGN
jgi:hypothetical protein